MRKVWSLFVAVTFVVINITAAATAQTTPSRADLEKAYRFLAQATFGARPADAQRLAGDLKLAYNKWIDEQVARSSGFSYENIAKTLPCSIALSQTDSTKVGHAVTQTCPLDVSETFWLGAVNDTSQLRQRVAFALSQILVISDDDGALRSWGNASAAYEEILYRDAFANFRTLLGDISHSDAMGKFLSFLYNIPDGTPASPKGQTLVPDQNFAREVMQLFTIGLVKLDKTGTPIIDKKTGKPIPTYTQDDVVGASLVMTGFGPYDTTPQKVLSDFKYNGSLFSTPEFQYKPAIGYPLYHATSAKSFLGVTINASSTSDPEADLNIFLDTLFHHPNVGPFIGKQLIQRLVVSNPSPAYVQRVAAVFDNNGAGKRGDLAAVVRAILLDPEARIDNLATQPKSYGKVREPILRMAQLLRILRATPGPEKSFQLDPASTTAIQLDQYPFRAGSVFNFYYSDFAPPLTIIADRKLVAPEMQLMTTATVAQLDAYLAQIFAKGGWYVGGDSIDSAPHFAFTLDYSNWLPLISSGKLIDQLNLQFMSGQMSAALQSDIQAEINATPAKNGDNTLKLARALRVLIASPEYIVQK